MTETKGCARKDVFEHILHTVVNSVIVVVTATVTVVTVVVMGAGVNCSRVNCVESAGLMAHSLGRRRRSLDD